MSSTAPNYFFAVRTNNRNIHQKMQEIQEHIKRQNSVLEKCFTSPEKLHLTLFVTTLANDADKKKAIEAMNHSVLQIEQLLVEREYQPLELDYRNLKSFGGKVVFIDVVKNESLSSLKEIISILKKSFSHVGLRYKGGGSWNPHLTVLKMNKCLEEMTRARIQRIEHRLYQKYALDKFGVDAVEEIALCSMEDEVDEDGFYKVIAKIDLKDFKNVCVQ